MKDDENKWLDWLWAAEQAYCDHKHAIDTSHAGPDSGTIAGWCPRCHFEWYVVLY